MKSKEKHNQLWPVTYSQFLILALAALIMVLMIQVANAQSGRGNQSSTINGNQTIQMKVPKKSFGERFLENTSLTYYQQFMGPTMQGPSTVTYNPFQGSEDAPGTGRAPLQSFHSLNLRHQISDNWAIGATVAAVNGYTEAVTTDGVTNKPDTQFFNARTYVTVPSLNLFDRAKLFTTLAYEFPTSEISKEQEMLYGLVFIASLAINSPNPKLSYGLSGQWYRMFYNQEVVYRPGYTPAQYQTAIVSGGPYLNYRMNDKWGFNSLMTFDWDQRGVQTLSREFNNNMEDRFRAGFSYYPSIKYISNVGVFTQGLLKFSPSTQILGAELAMRF